MKSKIYSLLAAAVLHEQRHLVLCAFGCGAFHNPVEEVAELFRRILVDERWNVLFDSITFAIQGGRPGHDTVGVFRRVFR